MKKFRKADGFDEALSRFIAAAQKLLAEDFARNYPRVQVPVLEPEELGRYVRICVVGAQRMAWAFIEYETGLIYKPAGWRGPSRHARGSIFSEQNGTEALGPLVSIRYLR
jgi:hypothetical protein